MSKTQISNKVIGKVYNYSLNSYGTSAHCIIKRDGDSHSPIILGQFVCISSEDDKNSVMLGRVENFQPDPEETGSTINAIRQVASSKHKRPMDQHYRDKGLFLTCSVRILGTCEIKGDRLKYYSNVRELKTVLSLEVAVPSSDFMTKLFKSAVEDSESGVFSSFEIGTLKYGTNPRYTDEFYGGANRVPVMFNAANLLRKRTGIFGKSGYGKSNTVKTVIGMMASKFPNCGQIIFDTNGEYALENDQNDGFMDIFHEAGIKGRTVLYTSRKIHEEKKAKFGENAFKQMKFDIFENITASMEIVMANFTGDTVPMYLHAWIQEALGVDDQKELFSAVKGNKGLVWGIWYHCCLKAGLTPLNDISQNARTQISKEFLNYLVEQMRKQEAEETPKNNKKHDTSLEVDMEISAEESGSSGFTFEELTEKEQAELLTELKIIKVDKKHITQSIETMAQYAEWKIQTLKQKENAKKKEARIELSTGEESSIAPYCELAGYSRRLFQLKTYNIGNLNDEKEKRRANSLSLGESVWKDLLDKKIIMIDLASVSSREAKVLSEQIAAVVMSRSGKLFGDSQSQHIFKDFDALIFIEEAQNYLSKEQVSTGTGIWERLAKEGRKFHLGLVYVTQQPTAIDEKISSQTENIIAMHMSTSSDTMFLNKIKDKFDELTCKFLKDEAEKGLAFIYAEPHQPFVLPAQIHLFNKELILSGLKTMIGEKKEDKKVKS